MRKSNSEFKTAFVSEAGGELANNDYFAYVELDDYACYVLASGITDFRSTEAAKVAAENFILNFQDKPTLSKSQLFRYLEQVNEILLQTQENTGRMKASIMAIVTDYEKMRYLAAGNVRLKMYHQGRVFLSSRDMSLAQDLIDRGEAETVLERHEERHNLYAYLGKPGSFNPLVSPKYKLKDGDILAFYTDGFWEHIDSQEIDEIFRGATDEPQESLDNLEDLLLSRQPANLKSYSFVAIFINKVYKDPEKERKRAMYIRYGIIALVIILIIGIIAYILYQRHQNKVESLKAAEEDTITYIKADNYLRAQESAKNAVELAKDIRDRDEEKRMHSYLMVVDAIVTGDNAMQQKDYAAAYDSYTSAMVISREADLMGMDYLEKRLNQAESHLFVVDFISLGNKTMDEGDLNKAEEIFFKARDKAAEVHDEDGRKAAMAALEKLYDQKAKQKQESEDKVKKASDAAVADAMKKGDELMEKGDVEGAEKAYLEARAIANSSGDKGSRSDAMQALEQVHQAKADKAVAEAKDVDAKNRDYALATDAVSRGDAAFLAGDYVSANVYYQTAIDKFAELGEADKVKAIQAKLDSALAKQGEGTRQKVEAQKAADEAKNKYTAGDYAGAQAAAKKAKSIYTAIGEKDKAEEMNQLLTEIEMDSVIKNNL